jgi:prepilin signal peptidase PulO-like enzyme (type II secretory pathway)
LVFSFFKLLDLSGFASSYAMYDLLAKRIYNYGFVYPFIELSLGVAYLINFNLVFTNTITLIVMSFSSIGVILAVIKKQKIKCACLGTGFNLPMTTVTIIEDLLMVAMAAWMLI